MEFVKHATPLQIALFALRLIIPNVKYVPSVLFLITIINAFQLLVLSTAFHVKTQLFVLFASLVTPRIRKVFAYLVSQIVANVLGGSIPYAWNVALAFMFLKKQYLVGRSQFVSHAQETVYFVTSFKDVNSAKKAIL